MGTTDRDPAGRPAPTRADEAEAPLRVYVEAKQAVAALLRELQRCAERSVPSVAERVRDLLVRVAEDRFQLVVIGQFKRGKTSLMNAIVGRPLLPTGSVPVTSAITSLRYGSAVRVAIRRAGQQFEQEVPIEALPDFITERGNPDNAKHVVSADVEVPAPFLRRGLRFVDTPGIGSAREQNTATTLAFLPEADAAVFVTGADAPLSEGELAFLDTVREHVRKLFFVVNKIDQLAAADRDEVLAYTARLLAGRLGVDAVPLFPVSAARALAVDAATAADSGLPALERALAAFLGADRQRVFLVSVLDRTIRVLDEARFTLHLHERARSSSNASQQRQDLAERHDRQQRDLQAAVDRARQRTVAWLDRELDPALQRFVAETRDALAGELPQAAQAWPASGDVAEAGRAWVSDQVRRRAAQWLASLADPVEALIGTVAREAQGEVAAAIERTLDLTAAAFGLEAHFAAVPPADPWRWAPPPFVPPETMPGLPEIPREASHLPVPHGLAVRLAVRRIAERLPRYLEDAAAALRSLVAAHLRACIDDLDAAAARGLDAERRRVGLALAPDEAPHAARPGAGGESAAAEIESLHARATAARDALLRREPLDQAVARAPVETAPASGEERRDRPEPEEGRRRIVTGTCPICVAMADALFDFLCHHQYAIAVDRAAQQRFLASRGLCPTHTWHLEAVASPHGLSESYPLLLEQAAARLRALAGQPARAVAAGLQGLRARTTGCPACAAVRQAEQAAGARLHAQLRTPEGRAAFHRWQWLCLSHLERLLAGTADEDAAELLRLHAGRAIELAEAMREYVLKIDARRRNLVTDEERRAYRKALVLLAGAPYLVVSAAEG